jgi:hypothetical protein
MSASGPGPDMTEAVMARLGYRAASSRDARRPLRRARAALPGIAVLALLAMGAWWFGGREVASGAPAAPDVARVAVLLGADRLDAVWRGLPRVRPDASSPAAVQVAEEGASPAVPVGTSGATAPVRRTY